MVGPVRISRALLEQILTENFRVIRQKDSDYGTNLWIHLNDFRFADWDRLDRELAKHNIFIDDSYEGDVNEIRLVLRLQNDDRS